MCNWIKQERAVQVLPGEVANLHVAVQCEVLGGSGEAGEATEEEDEALQELRLLPVTQRLFQVHHEEDFFLEIGNVVVNLIIILSVGGQEAQICQWKAADYPCASIDQLRL